MLRLYLFGETQLLDQRGNRLRLATRKVEHLLAYLWVHRSQPHPRESLAGILWPDADETSARTSLRSALHNLHKALEPAEDPDAPLLLLTRLTAQFNPKAPCWVDADEFIGKLKASEKSDGEQAIGHLQEAITLYQGEFAAGCFDDWCLNERRYLEEQYLEARSNLIELHRKRKEYEQAISHAKAVLELKPLLEDVHCQLIYLHYVSGNRNAALEQYDECTKILKERLDVKPSPETQKLYELVRERSSTKNVEEAIRHIELIKRYPDLTMPFTGRAYETGQIATSWDAAARGQGKAVLIAGEAGVGKTRLAHEIIHYIENRGGRALTGRCYDSKEPLPLQPWMEVLRRAITEESSAVLKRVEPLWLRELMKLAPEIGEHFPDLKPASVLLSPTQERARRFEAISQLLMAISQERPLVLFLDDLHWADESSIHLAQHLLERLPDRAILLLGAYRPEEMAQNPALLEFSKSCLSEKRAAEIELQPLASGDTTELVAGMLQAKATEGAQELARQLQERSKGNPFFLLELARSYVETGAVYFDAQAWHVDLEKLAAASPPESVQTAVESRLRRISRQSRELLEQASTLSKAFRLDFLQLATERQERDLIDELGALEELKFLSGRQDFYEFRHDVIREVIYRSHSLAKRRKLHLKSGEVLEALHQRSAQEYGDPVIGEIGHHFAEAGEGAKALPYLLRAGELAWTKSYAKAEALRFYNRALKFAEELGDENGLMQAYSGMGEVCCFTDEQDRGLEYCEKALKLCSDPERKAKIYLAIANVFHVKRELEKGLEYCQKGLVEFGEDNKSATKAHVLYHASTFLNWLNRYSEAIAYCDLALNTFGSSLDENQVAKLHSELAHAYDGMKQYDVAIEHLSCAIKLVENSGDPYSLGVSQFKLGRTFYHAGKMKEAYEILLRSLKITKLQNNPAAEASVSNYLIHVAICLSKLDIAMRYANIQREIFEKISHKPGMAVSYGMLACLHDTNGSISEADNYFDQALQICPEESSFYYNVIITYLNLMNIEKSYIWLKRGLPFLRTRQLEILKDGPDESPNLAVLRQDARFIELLNN